MARMPTATLLCKLDGHTSDINCCSWSPSDWNIFTSCSGDRTLRIWDISTDPPKTVSTVNASKHYVNACAYNPSGDLLVTASSSDEQNVRLWSTVSWTVVGTFSAHEESVRWCTFSPDGNLLATASDDTNVCIFEVGALKLISKLTRNSERVNCCVFSPAGWLLVSGSSSGDLMLFNVYNSKLIKSQLGSHDMGVTALALDPTSVNAAGQQVGGAFHPFKIASAGNDSIVRLWTVKCTGQTLSSKSVVFSCAAELKGHSAAVYSVSYHPSQPLLATGSADKSVILWNLVSLEPVQKLESHQRYVIHVSFSPNGRYLVSGSNDKTLSLWKLGSGPAATDSGNSSGSTVSEPSPSFLSEVKSWDVSDVLAWVNSISKQQSAGKPVHPDDSRAVDQLSVALEQVSTISAHDPGGQDDLRCPITQEIMRDPVLAADGYSYERSAITSWFSKGRRTSPVTNLPLTNTLLLPNRALKKIADKHRDTKT